MKLVVILAAVACAHALSWAPPGNTAPSPTNPSFPLQRNRNVAFNFKPWGSNVLLRQNSRAIDAFVPRLAAGATAVDQIDAILGGQQWTATNGVNFVQYTVGSVAVPAGTTGGTLTQAQNAATSGRGIVQLADGTFALLPANTQVRFDGVTPTVFFVAYARPAGGCGPNNAAVDGTIPVQTSTTFSAIASVLTQRCRLANAMTLAQANQFVVVAKGNNVVNPSINEGAQVSIQTPALLLSRAAGASPDCQPNFNFGQQPAHLFTSAYNANAIATRQQAGVDALPVYWLCPEAVINGVVTTWSWGANHAKRSSYSVQTPRYL